MNVAKIFTKLNVADTVATNGTRCFRKLIGTAIECFGQLVSKLFCNVQAEADTPVSIKMPTDGQLGVTGTPNAQNVDNLIVATGEFGGNVTAESADGINTTGTAEMKFAVCGRPTNGSIVFLRATDKWALGLLGSADPADTVESSGETKASIGTQAMPTKQGMTTMLFSTKGELNGTATHENADVAEQVNSYASGELNITAQPNVKNVYEATFVVNGKVKHQTAVLEGEAPSDPVADGTIEDTTKESTAQYHFHYAGWSRTEDGEPLDDLTVTEDTTFYAVYDKELRYYTIDFYDSETLYESKSVAYGDIPSVADPEKDGYLFDGWLPKIEAVTGDAEYYAAWIDMTGYVAYGTCGDDAIWTLDGDGKLTISGTGAIDKVGYAAQPWKSYKSQILAVEIKEGITIIGMNAFYAHTNLASVSLPNSLTEIHSYAFYQCTKLTSITIPAGVAKIESYTFINSGLTYARFEQQSVWKITKQYSSAHRDDDQTLDVSNATTAATYLTTYDWHEFYRT